MLLDLFVARRGLWIEAEPLVKIVRLVLAPAIPFQGIVREVERRFGFEIEHWGDEELSPPLAANPVPPQRGLRRLEASLPLPFKSD